jgi:hypothetical protein
LIETFGIRYLYMEHFEPDLTMTDFQGALKELILPPSAKPMPWEQHRVGNRGSTIGNRQLQRVRPKHKIMVSMHMAGWSNEEIARELGYKPSRVGTILQSQNPVLLKHREEVNDAVSRKVGDLVLRFRMESAKSLDTLVQIRDKEDAPSSERRLSALAILDRAGYTPVKKQINLDANIPYQELKGVVGQLESANEVVLRRDEWVIKDVPKDQP